LNFTREFDDLKSMKVQLVANQDNLTSDWIGLKKAGEENLGKLEAAKERLRKKTNFGHMMRLQIRETT